MASAPDYGTDISTSPTLDPSFGPLTGSRVVAEAVARRLTTPRGTLPDDPNYGTDLRAWLNESMTPATLTQVRSAAERECLKDERLQSADATVSYDAASGTLSVVLALALSAGPTFRLVLGVTAVSVTLLSAG